MLCRSSQFISYVLAIALFTGACADNSTGPDGINGGNGKGVTLLLTDAPGDVEAAVVTISEVFFIGNGGARINLLSQPFTGDLLTLQNAVATMVQGVEVPAGSYSDLRLVVTGAYIEVESEGGGSRIFASSPTYAGLPAGANVAGTLHMPSFGSSGLKVKLPGGKLDVGAGETIVLIDFDVKESFGHEAGKSGKWVLSPVVHATNVTFGGNVVARLQLGTGVTLPLLNGQQVTLGAFSAVLTPVGGGTSRTVVFTDANGDGIFEAMFKGLVPGQYTITFLFPTGVVGTFGTALPLTVTVASNQTVTETITLSTAGLASSIGATLTLGAGVTLPTVSGATTPVTLGQFRAQLTPTAGGAPVVVTFTNANNDAVWEANFPNLIAGNYSLTVLAPTGVTATYTPVPPVAITLAAGGAEVRAFTVATATAP